MGHARQRQAQSGNQPRDGRLVHPSTHEAWTRFSRSTSTRSAAKAASSDTPTRKPSSGQAIFVPSI